MTQFRYFEDFHPGDEIPLGTKTVVRDEVIAFASEFDPQPFHLDEEAGRASLLGGLAASGWHTASMVMRLLCDQLLLRSSCKGSPGVDEVRWMRPVLVGDRISVRAEILTVRPLRSRPALGLVEMMLTVTNQDGAPVMIQRSPVLFERREATA